MLIGLVVVAIILCLLVSSYLRKYKNADEKTLRPMSEWAVLVGSGSRGNAEKMSYSLIVQAEATLEKLRVIPRKSLRDLMISRPGLSKLSFVLLIKEATFDLSSDDVQFLEESSKTAQARTHMAQCIELILLRKGQSALERIADKACREEIPLR